MTRILPAIAAFLLAGRVSDRRVCLRVRHWRVRLTVIALAVLAGCSKAPPPPPARPGPGDTVFPLVNCPKSWQAGAPVAITVKLGVTGPHDSKPHLLTFEDVPHEPDLHATFVFYNGDEVIKTFDDVLLVPDC